MKTQIIQLNQKEDTISVKEKLSWCQPGRIVLVWPAQGHVLNDELELTLINRFAGSLGSQLAFITRDPAVKHIAGKLGIPVFDDTRQAQDQDWKIREQPKIERRPDFLRPGLEKYHATNRPKPAKGLSHPVVGYACLGISLAALLALVVYILPGARIELSPQEITQSIPLDIYADPAASSVNLSTGSLPTFSRDVVVEGSSVISTTGSLAIPDQPAQANMEFTNKSMHSITVPGGTIVTTVGNNPVRFLTQAGNDVIIKPGRSAVIAASALKPGSGGNLPANSMLAVEGDLGLELAVSNPMPVIGGTDVMITAPREQDLLALKTRNEKHLTIDAVQMLQKSLAEGDILVLPTVTVMEVLEETSSPGEGEPGDQLEMFQRLRVGAQVVSSESLRNLVIPILDANLPGGLSPVPNSLVITPLNQQTTGSDGRTHWRINASRRLTAVLSSSQLAQSIRGATILEAGNKLSEGLLLQDQAKIILFPSWWPWLPLLPLRITFAQVGS